MDRRSPGEFPLDDRRVYDAYVAGRLSAALAAGVRSGLFDRLDAEPLDVDGIVRELALAPRGVRALVAALSAYGLLVEDDGRFRLAPDASQYLVRGKPGSLWGLIDMEVEHFLSPAALLEALRTGEPSVYGTRDPWEAHQADPDAARTFTRAMHSVSGRPAAGFAEVAPLDGVRRLLDVGGGSGALSIAVARARPEIECAVLDLPSVCALAREYALEAGVGDRVTARAGDMFGAPLPDGFDAVLLSQILHDWPPEKGEALIAAAHGALPHGGRILIHEKLVAEDGTGPLANVLVHLDMLVWTEGQQYRESEITAMLERTGFGGVVCRSSAGYWSVISAVKR